MTVRELIEELLKLPPSINVVIADDSEGNSFSPLSQVSAGFYQSETTWYGYFIDHTDVKRLEGLEGSGASDAVCLWPVN